MNPVQPASRSGPGAWPYGSTRVAAVIGSPVRHSLSPVLHNAAFHAVGLDWAYVAFEVAEGAVPAALDGMRALGIRGMSVTMPHKAAVAAAVDRIEPAAAALGSVNCVTNRDGVLHGRNTDGEGFLRGLAAETGLDVSGRRVVVFGAGGAARAVILAVAQAGAADIAVVNRSIDRAVAAASLAGATGRVGTTQDVVAADLVINATPIGMAGTPAANNLPFSPRNIRPGQYVADLVYHPLRTPLLVAVSSLGGVVVTGIGMLVHQAALAFESWTGITAPIEAMNIAILKHLARSDDDFRTAIEDVPVK